MNPLFAVLPAIFAAAMGKATPEAQLLHPNPPLAAAPLAGAHLATPLAATHLAAGPAIAGIVNEGPVSGPLTPLIGRAVATPRGYADITLEGFSEDLNGDGFVDPIAPAALRAAPVAVHATPLAHAAPLAATTFAANPALNFAGFPTLNGAIAPLPLAAAPVEVAIPAPAVVETVQVLPEVIPHPVPVVEHVVAHPV